MIFPYSLVTRKQELLQFILSICYFDIEFILFSGPVSLPISYFLWILFPHLLKVYPGKLYFCRFFFFQIYLQNEAGEKQITAPDQ